MPTRDDNIHIFIDSPGDIAAEREVVRGVINELNEVEYFDNRLLNAVAWDSDDYVSVASRTPQENIIAGLPRPSACEISVFIFWSRSGT